MESAGGGGGAKRREGGRDCREKQDGEEGEGDSGLLPLLCGFLYTRWQAGCRFPRPPGKWVTEARGSAQTLAKEHPATERPENTFSLAAFSSSFLEGFIFCTLSFQILFL